MFRFTIRDVLWLTVVVGLGCALWIERGQSRQRNMRCLDFKQAYREACQVDVREWRGSLTSRFFRTMISR